MGHDSPAQNTFMNLVFSLYSATYSMIVQISKLHFAQTFCM